MPTTAVCSSTFRALPTLFSLISWALQQSSNPWLCVIAMHGIQRSIEPNSLCDVSWVSLINWLVVLWWGCLTNAILCVCFNWGFTSKWYSTIKKTSWASKRVINIMITVQSLCTDKQNVVITFSWELTCYWSWSDMLVLDSRPGTEYCWAALYAWVSACACWMKPVQHKITVCRDTQPSVGQEPPTWAKSPQHGPGCCVGPRLWESHSPLLLYHRETGAV